MTDELTVFAMIVTSTGCDVAALQALAQKPSFMMLRVDTFGKRARTSESNVELMLDDRMVVICLTTRWWYPETKTVAPVTRRGESVSRRASSFA